MSRSNGDPVDSPRGKSLERRKGRFDGGYTPTEQKIKDNLMKQFCHLPEGTAGNTQEYREAECWCACGRLKSTPTQCARCANGNAS